MANTRVTITPGGWYPIGTGLTSAIIQPDSDGLMLFFGASAPALSVVGFAIPAGIPVAPPNIAALGGGIWMRATTNDVTVVYDAA